MVRFNECRGMCLCHFTRCLMHNCTLCIAMFVHTKLRITNKPFLDSEILILYCYFVGRQGIKYHYLQYNTCIIARDFSLNSSKCIQFSNLDTKWCFVDTFLRCQHCKFTNYVFVLIVSRLSISLYIIRSFQHQKFECILYDACYTMFYVGSRDSRKISSTLSLEKLCKWFGHNINHITFRQTIGLILLLGHEKTAMEIIYVWLKLSNHTIELHTTLLPKTLRHLIYRSSHL
jgi:hypothetical protein